MDDHRVRTTDPFLLNYDANDLRVASEFLSNWLPFLSRGLCRHCTHTLSDRIRSLDSETEGDAEPVKQEENVTASPPNTIEYDEYDCNQDNCDTNSFGSWKGNADMNDTADTNSLGSWKDDANEWSEPVSEASTSERVGSPVPQSPRVRRSWADMAQEDELEEEEEKEVNRPLVNGNILHAKASTVEKAGPKPELPREQREYIRFNKVKRNKDFICFERINGKFVNILQGLELHCGVFSAVEQKRIVESVYEFQEMGKKGELKERTFSAPQKWMKGKGRVTIQFGCCYNYATDKSGNPPGILQDEMVDPIPSLFKVIIKRLVRWHVLPPTCVPDSCIVNIYEEGDCIPPHIDNHDFVRPFCTLSFLSECNIVFGSNLKIVDAGEFAGSIAVPLPVGSVLVLNGNGADLAKHCVPAVPTKRISITFRRMDDAKRPIGYVPEPDLQGLQPLCYETNGSKQSNASKSKRPVNRQGVRREDNAHNARGLLGRGSQPRYMGQIQQGPANRQKVRVRLDDEGYI
ncbi:unnamed protein product [Ilex paraguariensis]|uniref:Fe2OG dioxygenase domain-containing protein n=1 Tax=Ilex paraguariensis TaxID=185542 RepID=A0ABC8SIT0_9AQUA